jgi:hypothetical protein
MGQPKSDEDLLERNMRLAQALNLDLKTAQAVKTQSTEILAGVVADYLAERLELLLTDPALKDHDLLALIHEARGTLRALGEIGDAVRRAHLYVAKKAVRDRMGLQPITEQEGP